MSWVRNASLLSVLALGAAGCLSVDPPEGHLQCATAADCPSGWVCRADDRCWRTSDGVDGGPGTPDVGPHDGGPDMGLPPRDSGMDTSTPTVDAGTDAAMPMVDGGLCTMDAQCDDGNMCTDDHCNAGACANTAHDCSDSVACTVDSCTPTTGCSHVNSDSMCASGRTCMPGGAGVDGMGCVVSTACGSVSECDDHTFCTTDSCTTGHCMHVALSCPMDSSPCTLAPVCNETASMCVESYDPSSATSIAHCGNAGGTCSICGATHPTRMPVCAAGACSEVCMAGLGDADHNPANGCECTIMSATDAPDDAAADANCDGADGVIGTTIYVTPGGAGTHDGTSPANAATLDQGFAIAHSSARTQMLVAAGSYSGELATLSMVDGMTIFGGYAMDFRSRSGASNVISLAAPALAISGLTSGSVDSVNFASTVRITPGGTTHTVDILSSHNVTLSRLTIDAADGARGVDGTTPASTGTPGAGGGVGGAGGLGPAAGGAGGASGGTSGAGGAGGGFRGATPGDGAIGRDAAGATATCGQGAAAGGVSDTAVCTSIGGTGGAHSGGTGGVGCIGGPGSAGAAGTSPGSMVGSMWVASTPGAGGIGMRGISGGGGSGGGAVYCSGSTAMSGSGGGGGGGGESGGGGMGGLPAGGGGSSIGIVAVGSSFRLDTVVITTGRGGAGGGGADGSAGGSGGTGGAGGSGAIATYARSGAGGRGGAGGAGGPGGCGGAGAGGDSICAVGATSSMVAVGCTFTPGGGGAGGAACSSGGSPGATGVMMDHIGL